MDRSVYSNGAESVLTAPRYPRSADDAVATADALLGDINGFIKWLTGYDILGKLLPG